MPDPGISLTLPDGWTQLANPDGPLTCSPDEGDCVLQLSSPSWGAQLRGQDDADVITLISQIVDGRKLGRMISTDWSELEYGRALRAEVNSDEHEEVMAWLIISEAHDVVLATWIAGTAAYGDSALEVISRLRPGMFSAAIASAVSVSSEALANNTLSPHAVLFGDGTITQLALETLPQEIWTEACRAERAHLDAGVVVQVLAATARGRDVAVIYAESATRHRRLLVDGALRVDLDAERLELFGAPDPRIAAALAAARR